MGKEAEGIQFNNIQIKKIMKVQYQGKQNGISTTFSIKIIGNNLSKSSSNYELELFEGENTLPLFTTAIHQSLSNCLVEIHLFFKNNNITLDVSSEKIVSNFVTYDQALYDFNKKIIFA